MVGVSVHLTTDDWQLIVAALGYVAERGPGGPIESECTLLSRVIQHQVNRQVTSA